MTESNRLWCNICGLALSTTETKEHTLTSSHTSLKQKLEQDLERVQNEHYDRDNSVVLQWKNSV